MFTITRENPRPLMVTAQNVHSTFQYIFECIMFSLLKTLGSSHSIHFSDIWYTRGAAGLEQGVKEDREAQLGWCAD